MLKISVTAIVSITVAALIDYFVAVREPNFMVLTILITGFFAVLITFIVGYFTLRSQKLETISSTDKEAKEKLHAADATLQNAKSKHDDIINEAQAAAKEIQDKANAAAKEIQDKAIRESETVREQTETAKKFLIELNKRLNYVSSELFVAETSVFVDNGVTSEEYKNKLAMLDVEYKEYIKNGDPVISTGDAGYSMKKRIKDNYKQILRCFNAEAEIIVNAVTDTNVEQMRGKLTKSFQTINSIFATDCIELNKKLLDMRLQQLSLLYSYQKKKALEREEQKAIRQQMLEEEKVRREIEREKAKVEKEESQFKNEVDKLMKYLAKAGEVEKQIYIDKINELNEKLKLLEKDKQNILQREQNTRAGFVYIISNIGSFGENIYKIGMTRRLEPMDRIKELGDASVPFEFDVHAMIFSDDAPALETILHNTFKDNQVNLVNPRKEFYNVSLAEIEKVVKEKYNATVTFTQVAEAAQYRESLKMREAAAKI